jgi:hypothetical protein
MKKQIIAAMLLLILLLPMFAGIRRIKNLPRDPEDGGEEEPHDDTT